MKRYRFIELTCLRLFALALAASAWGCDAPGSGGSAGAAACGDKGGDTPTSLPDRCASISLGEPDYHTTGDEPADVAAVDLDADGELDLAVLNIGQPTRSLSVLLGKGGGELAAAKNTPLGWGYLHAM